MKNSYALFTLFVCILLVSSCNKGPKPVAAFTFEPTSALARDSVRFTSQSTNASTYRWTFGDDSLSTVENPVHQYRSGGTFAVTLTATGEGGESSLSKEIVILPSLTGKWSSTFISFGTINGTMTLLQSSSGVLTGTVQINQNSTQTAVIQPSNITGAAVVIETIVQGGGRNGGGKYSFKGTINDAYDYITGSAFLEGRHIGTWYAIKMRGSF